MRTRLKGQKIKEVKKVKRARASDALTGEQRTNIRMSKLARTMQTAVAKTNWTEMVKMLFRSDPHSGRKDEIRKLTFLESHSLLPHQATYSIDQVQYLFSLMLIISIAEKQTQEMYRQDFAQRCDAIGKEHKLADDEYWKDGAAPKEWNELAREFEKASLRILIETL